jgi:hypothetical protein
VSTHTVNDIEYAISPLNAKQQWHVTRRLAPVIAAYFATCQAIDGDLNLFLAAAPLAEMLAKMSDSDSDYVTDTCLSVCKRKQDSGYAKVMVNGNLMFSDMNMDAMLGLTLEVIKTDVLPFFPKNQTSLEIPQSDSSQ